MMMALGMFVFSLETLAYQEFQRQTDWRHGSTSRIGSTPAGVIRRQSGPPFSHSSCRHRPHGISACPSPPTQ